MTFWHLAEDVNSDPTLIRVYRWLLQWPEAIAFQTLIVPTEVSAGTGLSVADVAATLELMAERGYIVLESKRSDGAVWVSVRPASEQLRKPAPEIVRPVVPPRERREVPLGIRWNVLERDGHRCRSCGAGAEDAKLVIDHIKPFSKGGPTVEANLQTLCFECNSGKRDKYVEGSP